MSVTVVVGTQWGDEGKGKVTDVLTREADVVARFQGGNNAGHTVVVGEDTFKFHLLPSGVVREGIVNVLGNGVVVDAQVLVDELEDLAEAGIEPTIHISDRAHVILPYHRLLDGAEEEARGESIGTTKRGIGPTYSDKMSRSGIRVGDLLDASTLRERLEDTVASKTRLLQALGKDVSLDVEELVATHAALGKRLEPFVTDTVKLLGDAVDAGEKVLLEGAQGTFLDIDHGTYPFVTSSNTTAGGAATGTGIPPTRLDEVVGVVKAYTTRVGGGPFPTELPYEDPVGEHLTEVGHEFGTTTGRRRRVGWLDLVVLRRAARVNGLTAYALTKVDVLEGLEAVEVCVAYEHEDGTRYEEVPSDPEVTARCTPVYETLEGFSETVENPNAEGLEKLSVGARAVVDRVSEAVGCEPCIVSYGPARSETILLRVPL